MAFFPQTLFVSIQPSNSYKILQKEPRQPQRHPNHLHCPAVNRNHQVSYSFLYPEHSISVIATHKLFNMSQYYVPQYQHYATTSFPQYGTTFATPTHTTGTLYTVPKPQTTYCFRSQQRSYIVPSQAPMFYHPGKRYYQDSWKKRLQG